MAIVIGHPGSSARKNWFIDLFVPPVVFFVVFVLLGPIVMRMSTRLSPTIIVLEMIAGAAIAGLIWRKDFLETVAMMRGASNWAKGADGEALTGQALASLSDSYIVFHDFKPVSAGVAADWNVDHIVIGPNGMFVLETKNYSQAAVAPASKSSFTRKNVAQTRRNSLLFKDKIRAWSAGGLGDVFVVPILVYVQDGAFVNQIREGDVRVIPLKWLATEITDNKSRRLLNPDEIYRIAHVMFQQLEPYLMDAYRTELDRYGAESRRFKLERAKGRSASQSEAVYEPAAPAPAVSKPEAPVGFQSAVPTLCPNCGGVLVQRTAYKGPRTGKRFLGCANYKDLGCRFIHNLED